MVNTLDSLWRGPRSSQDTDLSQCLSPPRNIMDTGDKMLGDNLRWTGIPSRGSSNTPSRFMLRKLQLNTIVVGYLDRLHILLVVTIAVWKAISNFLLSFSAKWLAERKVNEQSS